MVCEKYSWNKVSKSKTNGENYNNQYNNHHTKTNKNNSKNKNQKRLTNRSSWYLINLTVRELKSFLDSRIDNKKQADIINNLCDEPTTYESR